MSTGTQNVADAPPTGRNNNNNNKRAAVRQQNSGKWKRRQVWRERDEGSQTGDDRESSNRQQQASKESSNEGPGEASERRLPKRKVAIVFGYNGSGYAGLQIQTGSDKRTIEADVADAILSAGGMLATNREQLSKLSWQRCARTDKGVHAATNVLSLNLITQPDGVLQRINSHLPAAIRCFALLRVMGSFHAKFSCTSRAYHYILPAYAFDPAINQHINHQLATERGAREEVRRQKAYDTVVEQQRDSGQPSQPPAATANSQSGSGARRKGVNNDSDSEPSGAEDETAEDDFDSDRDAIVISDELRAQLLAYRMPDDLHKRVESLLQRYVGTHNYYNFTRHKLIRNREDKPTNQRDNNTAHSSTDHSAHFDTQPAKPIGPVIPVNRNFHADRNNRHILSFTIDRTLVDPTSNLQLLVLAVHGQSFMLNQIRKMVGLAVLTARGMVGDAVWSRVFRERGLYVPTAPSLGLYLERPNFAHYDNKCREGKEQQQAGQAGGTEVSEDSERPAVQQVYDEHEAEIAQFRQSVIYPSICETEVEQFAFYRWLAGLGLHPSLAQQDGTSVQTSATSASAQNGNDSTAAVAKSSIEPEVNSIDHHARERT